MQSESNIDFEMKLDEESSSDSTVNNIRTNANKQGSLVAHFITDKELAELGKQVFKESDEEFIKRVREASPYGGLKTW